jgi:predicted lysophospholipase L1 biosynthesis ABC-type transport system permease subunit
VISPRPHGDVRNLQRVAKLPRLLAGLVALLGLGTMTHAVVTPVRRRRDLAVLKTLGFTRGQVAATISWQATTFAVVALAIGLPSGVAAGRWAWQLTADTLGVQSSPVVPLAAMAAAAGRRRPGREPGRCRARAGGEPAAASHGPAAE